MKSQVYRCWNTLQKHSAAGTLIVIRSSCAKQVALISPTVSDVCLLCSFWMYSLLGFGLKRACTSLQAVCMIMVYFTEHLNHLLCFFDQESCLIQAAYFTSIYSWGKLCNHKCPHSLFVWSLFLTKKESQTHSIVGSVCLFGCNLPHLPPHSCCSLLACMSGSTTFVSTLLQPISSAFWFCFHAILSPL
jgi:hypothetical protein